MVTHCSILAWRIPWIEEPAENKTHTKVIHEWRVENSWNGEKNPGVAYFALANKVLGASFPGS